MRRFCPVVLLLILAWPLCALEIETAHPRYYKTDDIRTISEYFGSGKPEQGFRTLVPSIPAEPGGQYFICKLTRQSGSEPIAEARITLYTTSGKEPATHSWDLSGHLAGRWLYLGLTGADWPGESVLPLAWRIELLSGQGTLLAEWKSFLWEMP